jgi:hypothetical protein
MSHALNAVLLSSVILSLPVVAQAETEISVYGGYQTAPHSVISGSDPRSNVVR